MSKTKTQLNLQDAGQVCELFDKAAKAYRNTPTRQGSMIDLSDRGWLVVTGDLHDHRDHFENAVHLARLHDSENNHIVLQEIIHGDSLVNGIDLSYRMLARAARLKLRYPDQVHHLLSNHEMAQVTGDGILKGNVSVVDVFNTGLAHAFGGEADAVAASISRYVRSLPLALRCANGVLCAHSLPAPRRLTDFDPTILDRKLGEADYKSPDGSAYLMVWGRRLTQSLADALAQWWDVKAFVLGHQHTDMGWDECGDSMLILNSDHERGVALPIDLSRTYSRDDLTREVIPLAAVGD